MHPSIEPNEHLPPSPVPPPSAYVRAKVSLKPRALTQLHVQQMKSEPQAQSILKAIVLARI